MDYINYYENRVRDTHKQWVMALEEGKPISAALHKKDYETYKEAYENRMEKLGMEVCRDL